MTRGQHSRDKLRCNAQAKGPNTIKPATIMLQRAARRVVAASPGRYRPVVKLLAHALRGFVDIDQQLSVGGLTKKGQHRDSSGGQSPISLNYNQADLFRLEIADAIDT